MIIAIDFETYLISNESPSPKPVCLSYYYNNDGDEQKGIVIGLDSMEAFLSSHLKSNNKIIAHNMSFEALVIDAHFPNLRADLHRKINNKELICTKVYEQLLDNTRKHPGFRHDLATLVNKYFEVDISADKKDPDSWRLRYSELDGVPLENWPKEAIDYAIDDSIWAYEVYKKQYEQDKDLDIFLSISADIYLNKMGQYGLLVDKGRVKTLEDELLEKLTPKYKNLESKGLTRFDEKTSKYKKNMNVLREYLTEKLDAVEKTSKGTVATSSESITRYVASTDNEEVKSVLTDYLDIMKYEKILTAFVSRLKSANPVIRTSYKAAVSSGRTSSSSSSQYPSVNIQQMPREVPDVTWDIRNCFIPREGYKICSIDYSGLELSSTAHQLKVLTGKQDMLNIINRGDTPVDMHSMLAYRIMNIKEKSKETYDSFVTNKKKAPYKDYRQLAKPINLGFPGGIGYDTMRTLLARENIYPKLVVLETSEYEDNLVWKRGACRKEGYPVRIRRTGFREYQLIYDELVLLKQELFALYPDLEFFLTEGHLKYCTEEFKMVKNEFDEWEKEPMYSFQVGDFKRDWCMYTQVCNGLLMQSPAAIGAKKAMVKIIQRYGDSKAIRPLAFIHDEIVFEVINDKNMKLLVQDISEIMIDEMQSVLSSVRIAVEAEVFDYWKKAGGFYEATYFKDANNSELKGDLVV